MNELDYVRRIFIYFGICMSNVPAEGVFNRLSRMLCDIIFPLITHINLILILWMKFCELTKENVILYGIFLDVLMSILPCALWWSVRHRKSSIHSMIQELEIFKERNGYLKNWIKLVINCGALYWLIFIFILSFTASCVVEQDNTLRKDSYTASCKFQICCSSHNSSLLLNVRYDRTSSMKCRKDRFIEDSIQFMQQFLFPFIFSVLFFTIFYNFVQNLNQYKKMLENLDSYSENRQRILFREYLDLIKCADRSSETFSTPLFYFACEMCSYLSISFLDIVSMSDFNYLLITNTASATLSWIALTVILTFYADKIPLKIDSIKKALSNMKAERLLSDVVIKNSEVIDIAINRETVQITVGGIASFDKAFLLKSATAIIAHAIIYHQLTIDSESS